MIGRTPPVVARSAMVLVAIRWEKVEPALAIVPVVTPMAAFVVVPVVLWNGASVGWIWGPALGGDKGVQATPPGPTRYVNALFCALTLVIIFVVKSEANWGIIVGIGLNHNNAAHGFTHNSGSRRKWYRITLSQGTHYTIVGLLWISCVAGGSVGQFLGVNVAVVLESPRSGVNVRSRFIGKIVRIDGTVDVICRIAVGVGVGIKGGFIHSGARKCVQWLESCRSGKWSRTRRCGTRLVRLDESILRVNMICDWAKPALAVGMNLIQRAGHYLSSWRFRLGCILPRNCQHRLRTVQEWN